MQRVGFFTGGWLIFSILVKVLMAAAIFRYPKVHDSFAHHVPFSDPYFYAIYLLAAALCCALILFGELRALHFWFMMGCIAGLWQFLYQPGFSPVLALSYLIGPIVCYILLSFGGSRKTS